MSIDTLLQKRAELISLEKYSEVEGVDSQLEILGAMEGISTTTVVTCSSASYTYSHVTTIKFFYVKPYGSTSIGNEYLSYITTMGVTAVGGQWNEFVSSESGVEPTVVQIQKTVTTVPTGYSSEYNAVEAFVNDRQDINYVRRVTIEGLKNQHVLNINLPAPINPSAVQ